MQRIVEYVKVQVDISIIAGELDSSGQPYPLDCHDRLFTEDDDADATTYDSDADDAACSGDELWAQGGTVPPDPWSLDYPLSRSVPCACVLVSPLYYKPSRTQTQTATRKCSALPGSAVHSI